MSKKRYKERIEATIHQPLSFSWDKSRERVAKFVNDIEQGGLVEQYYSNQLESCRAEIDKVIKEQDFDEKKLSKEEKVYIIKRVGFLNQIETDLLRLYRKTSNPLFFFSLLRFYTDLNLQAPSYIKDESHRILSKTASLLTQPESADKVAISFGLRSEKRGNNKLQKEYDEWFFNYNVYEVVKEYVNEWGATKIKWQEIYTKTRKKLDNYKITLSESEIRRIHEKVSDILDN